MPDETMASAAPFTRSSLTLQPNLFQVFQPMGGVRARPFEGGSCANAAAAKNTNENESNMTDVVSCFLMSFYSPGVRGQFYQINGISESAGSAFATSNAWTNDSAPQWEGTSRRTPSNMRCARPDRLRYSASP